MASRSGKSRCRSSRRVRQSETKIDTVCFQTWFDMTDEQIVDLVERLKATYEGARLVYFDWFAPTDLRYSSILTDRVDFYVKKHLLRDRSAYGRITLGDTNLTDYYARRFDLPLDPVTRRIPDTFWSKLIVGSNFALTSQILSMVRGIPNQQSRPIDVHSRIATGGTPWYTAMRKEALSAAEKLQGMKVVMRGRVSRREYCAELFASKICFSPFGYGEVCWRDYEAILAGALLVKPDMAHVETCPDLFRPFETYVPVRWDLSDLQEKLEYYLAHPDERIAMAERALHVIYEYLAGDGFLKQMEPMLRPVSHPVRLETVQALEKVL